MKVLLLAFGSRGDVQPYVALGAALRARGHSVTLATAQGFESLIERHGLTPASVSADIRELIARPEMQAALHSWRARLKAFRETKPLMRALLEDMTAIARETRPEVLIYSVKAPSAPHLAEALDAVALPSFQIPAFVPTGAFPSPLLPLPSLGSFGNRAGHRLLKALMAGVAGRMVKDWRRTSLGLEGPGPRDPFEGFAPDGRDLPRLHGYSRHLVPGSGDWALREAVTGYWFLDQAAGWQPPAALARFLAAGPPPVYVGFGSMPSSQSAALTRSVLAALATTGQRAVLATGWGGLSEVEAGERVHILESAPHDWLFPRCATVVHHGGAGTTHEGLRWGRPTVVCPVFGDQPFWGRRIAELGAGPKPLPQKHLTSEALAAALREAQAVDVVARAAELGTAIRAEPGAEAGADLVESLATA